MLYIKRLHLKDIRSFEELTILIDNPGSSVLILGDNGDGKSTVLRSLAMGLCDESSASALFRELPGEFVRRTRGHKHVPKGKQGTITVDLEEPGQDSKPKRYRIRTTITSQDIFERVSQRDGLYKLDGEYPDPTEIPLNESEFPWSESFVSGYGAGSRTQGTADFTYYLPVDAVYPIFYYSVPLQNPELAVRRLIGAANSSSDDNAVRRAREQKVLSWVKEILTPILDLSGDDAVTLTSNAILLKGHWGEAELGEAGDGYRATVTWILDLLSWWFLHYFTPEDENDTFDNRVRSDWDNFVKEEPSGIVIIDEVDQHLHPRWQHSILASLTKAFPKIQFIATTHSPMTVIGATDVAPDRLSLLALIDSDEGTIARSLPPPTRMRADQVLTASYFRLPIASDNEIKRMIAEYSKLASLSSPDNEQKTRLAELKRQLDETLGAGETELEQKVMNAISETLRKDAEEVARNAKVTEEIKYETIRQLKQLLGDEVNDSHQGI